MSKTNFTEAEENFENQLKKIKLANLLKEADIAQGKKEDPLLAKRRKQLKFLEIYLNILFKKEKEFYKSLPLKRKDIAPLLAKMAELSAEEQAKIEQCIQQIESYKEKKTKTSPESQIQQEQYDHIYKRFNVNENWLPLK